MCTQFNSIQEFHPITFVCSSKRYAYVLSVCTELLAIRLTALITTPFLICIKYSTCFVL